MMDEKALRQQICLIGRLMHQREYVDGGSGNISVRLDEQRILATPSGLAKGFMEPEQLIVVNMQGERSDEPTPANAHLRPTSELLMHLECYRQRPDVQGVVHAHPLTCIALTVAGYDFQRCVIPETVMMLGLIPVAPYATPASTQNRDAISALILEHDAILLSHHGSLTVGKSVWDAYLRLENLEHSAKILFMAEQLGRVNPIPSHQVAELVAIRKRLGLMRPGDEDRFAKFLKHGTP